MIIFPTYINRSTFLLCRIYPIASDGKLNEFKHCICMLRETREEFIYCLGTFSADATSQLDVFGHDGDTFGVDGAEIGVFKETNEVCFGGFLQRKNGGGPEQ